MAKGNFHLGLDGSWTDSSDDEAAGDAQGTSVGGGSPPRKLLRLSLSRGKKTHKADSVNDENRWSFINESEAQSLSKKCVPKNTAVNTKWALTNFLAWKSSRNMRFEGKPDELVPEDILQNNSPRVLAKWLAVYAAESRKQDGGRYPPKTIYSLLTGILRYMRSLNPTCPNFLDFSNKEFAVLENSLDNIFRDLRVKGVGSESKSADVFTKDDEEKLWSSGVLSLSTPTALLRAVFFYNGKIFCLRGGEEHRHLKLSQFRREMAPPTVCLY